MEEAAAPSSEKTSGNPHHHLGISEREARDLLHGDQTVRVTVPGQVSARRTAAWSARALSVGNLLKQQPDPCIYMCVRVCVCMCASLSLLRSHARASLLYSDRKQTPRESTNICTPASVKQKHETVLRVRDYLFICLFSIRKNRFDPFDS